MCMLCVHEVAPDRGSTCMENGAYLLNFKGCNSCGATVHVPRVMERVEEEDDDGEEEITFNHVCAECGHVIARHEYTFSVKDGVQYYSMNCDLCGVGEDEMTVMPSNRGASTNGAHAHYTPSSPAPSPAIRNGDGSSSPSTRPDHNDTSPHPDNADGLGPEEAAAHLGLLMAAMQTAEHAVHDAHEEDADEWDD